MYGLDKERERGSGWKGGDSESRDNLNNAGNVGYISPVSTLGRAWDLTRIYCVQAYLTVQAPCHA